MHPVLSGESILSMARVLLLLAVLAVFHTANAQMMESELVAGVNMTTLTMQRVPYNADIPLNAFLTYDNRTNVARPAIIIVPDSDGNGPYEQWRAMQLANLGYVAMVADVFGANITQGPSLPSSNRSAFVQTLLGNPALLRSRMVAAINTVKTLPVTNGSQIAAIGYCLGGSAMVELARANVSGLLGVVGFHPGQLNTTGSKIAPGAIVKIALHSGNLDIPNGKPEFVAEMAAANVTWEFHEYSNTPHAFTNPTNVPGTARSAYNRQADMRSWASMRTFFLELFGKVPMSNIYTYSMAGSAL
ncbi:hypothetical protein KFL_006210020 [Klebsormidium nitens]|uniref:Dienelactone hydrolase domain-containing protein n=1 Tax=Klebsormidium nitens TaxID=105231 RepID=A0A1Y1INT4_KLENI|nr:hypothetical protein KFL_006210020 [Klebsormidium nitens]|eukprot:GAQ90277.1 hypothetical protein KFL_006210020 [Klebsormidium nitens]